MSSRALRKLQKEQELEKQLAAVRELEAAQAEQDEHGDEEAEADVDQSTAKMPLNVFDMLEGVDEDEDDEDDGSAEIKKEELATTSTHPLPSRPKKKKRKAKKKDKGKAQDNMKPTTNGDMDEIDQALKEISMKNHEPMEDGMIATETEIWLAKRCKMLGLDSKNLNPVNEMRSLFGNIALEAASSNHNQRRRQQEQIQQGGMDLGTALLGRHCPGTNGKELGPLAHRRNILMQGKEEWPGATSGGLSMEVAKDDEFSWENHYNIIHDRYYQETQSQFAQCVQTMEPQNLIGLLQMKPYHIATLLQVSEIAKLQGDHSVSGDLLERALFSFGRSVHSSFAVAAKEGLARLNFWESANRELYLTIWRYIRNLEQRGTWKTAFEWSKLLLQIDTVKDPYAITLMFDQLALRGRQHVAFIEMCNEDAYGQMWNHLPNIQISLALAYVRNKQAAEARQALAVAMHKYPYILSDLAKSLEIEPLPRSLWGKLPSTEAETLYTQLYVTRAKDLWNTPELTSLLVEVAETLPHYETFIAAALPAPRLEISLEEARHVMLLEIPALIGLLPRKYTNMRTSVSDPLPPPDSATSNGFTARAPAGVDGSGTGLVDNVFLAAAGAAGGLFDRILDWWHAPAGDNSADAGSEEGRTMAEMVDRFGEENIQALLGGRAISLEAVQAQRQALNEEMERDRLMMTMHESERNMEGSDAETDNSLPELESMSGTASPPRPMAATVEDDEDDGDVQPSNPAPLRPLLRHVDSDEDGDDPQSIANLARQAFQNRRPQPDIGPHPEPTHTVFASTSHNPSQAPVIEPTDDIETTRDPQRIQRWLLSTGLENIKNGANMAKYVDRLQVLSEQQRDWTIRMVEQKGGAHLAAQVRAASGE